MTNLQLYLWTLKNTSWLWGWGIVAIVLTYFIERKVLGNGKRFKDLINGTTLKNCQG